MVEDLRKWEEEHGLVTKGVSKSGSIKHSSEYRSTESNGHQDEDATLNQHDTVVQRIQRPSTTVLGSVPSVIDPADVCGEAFYGPGMTTTNKNATQRNKSADRTNAKAMGCTTSFIDPCSVHSEPTAEKVEEHVEHLDSIQEVLQEINTANEPSSVDHSNPKAATVNEYVTDNNKASGLGTRKKAVFWHTENKSLSYVANQRTTSGTEEQEIEELQETTLLQECGQGTYLTQGTLPGEILERVLDECGRVEEQLEKSELGTQKLHVLDEGAKQELHAIGRCPLTPHSNYGTAVISLLLLFFSHQQRRRVEYKCNPIVLIAIKLVY